MPRKQKTYPVAVELVDDTWTVWVIDVAGNRVVLAKDAVKKYAERNARRVAWELNINATFEAFSKP